MATRRIQFAALGTILAVSLSGAPMRATAEIIEDFEFAASSFDASTGVTDCTDAANQPTFFLSGYDSENGVVPVGEFSLGIDVLFGAGGKLVPGSFVGFRRNISTTLFPAGRVDLQHTYGDPDVPGPTPADHSLADLAVLGDFAGAETFGEGFTGTHLWVNLIDAEGERFNFVSHSEPSLFLEYFTLDVRVGDAVGIDPASIVDVPNGDRLLTEIVAFEVKIQDADDPPTGADRWFIDNLRIEEPANESVPGDGDDDGDVDLLDLCSFNACVTGADNGPPAVGCDTFDLDADNDIDFSDFAQLQAAFTGTP